MVLVVYTVAALPCFAIIWLLLYFFKKYKPSRVLKVSVFSLVSALLFSPVMLPAASIMVLPAPSFYLVTDLYSGSGREYALKHFEHFPVLSVLGPAITLALSAVLALKFFPNKLSEPTP